jgi:tetratricopeptide (TPR) repeat protein
MQLKEFREAIRYFSTVVRIRPRNISSWEALIRCLYHAKFYTEAQEQTQVALRVTGGKPIFVFYLSVICFAMGKSKQGLLHLEKAMSLSPKLLKKMVVLSPAILQNQSVVDLVARYKKNKML